MARGKGKTVAPAKPVQKQTKQNNSANLNQSVANEKSPRSTKTTKKRKIIEDATPKQGKKSKIVKETKKLTGSEANPKLITQGWMLNQLTAMYLMNSTVRMKLWQLCVLSKMTT